MQDNELRELAQQNKKLPYSAKMHCPLLNDF